MDITAIGGINSIFSFLAFLVIYAGTEIAKHINKRKKYKESDCLRRKSELINLIKHFPHQEKYIDILFAEYKKRGYNSYVDGIYSAYKESTETEKTQFEKIKL
jgi:hypothetical protein